MRISGDDLQRDQARYLEVLAGDRPLRARAEALGLLDGQPDDVRQYLPEWFDSWAQQAPGVEQRLLRRLHDAVEARPKEGILFVFCQVDEGPGVPYLTLENVTFPTDPVVFVLRGVHP